MAGAGYKLFNTGDVLTAAQVNTYLMEQTVMVFADAAARTAALSGVVAEGMISYLKDTNAVEVYNGSAWVASDDPNAIQNTIVDAKGDLISASAADTPARLAVGSDYTILQALSSQSTGLTYGGGFTAYTPTWTATSVNPSLGNGTLVGGYRRIGDVIDFYLTLTMGSTTTFGTGSWRFTLPVAVTDANNNYGYTGNALDSGTAWYSGLIGSGAIIPSTTTFGMRNTADTASLSATVPFTWTTNDVLLFKGSYKVN